MARPYVIPGRTATKALASMTYPRPPGVNRPGVVESGPMLAQLFRKAGPDAGAIIARPRALRMSSTNDPTFLRRCELFESQPPEVLGAVLAQGQFHEYGPGEVVVHQGEPGDRLYVVKDGILEVLAFSSDSTEPVPIAYLGTGEVLGELALLTGSPRSATVRCPQGAELFAVEKAVFLDLMDELPTLSRHLCVVLARRLEATNLKLPRSPGKQLQGKLEYFDLATVIQTLIGSHQTGSLVVSHDKQKLAELFFFRGNIARAKYRNLIGDDAVFQLFLSPVDGEFSFTGGRSWRARSRPTSACPRSPCSWSRCGCRTSCQCSRSGCPTPRAPSTRRPSISPGTSPRRSSWPRPCGRGSRRARAWRTCSGDPALLVLHLSDSGPCCSDTGQIE